MRRSAKIMKMGNRFLARSSILAGPRMARLVSVVQTGLKSRPLVTNCIVFGTLSGLAEFSQQTLLYKILPCKEDRTNYDMAAVGRYVILGGALFAPVLHYWFRWLDKFLPGKSGIVVLKKVTLDAVVLDVPYYTAFYMAMGTMEGKPASVSFDEVKTKLVPTIIYSLFLWLPAQAINFRFLPPHLRVTYIALVTFLELNMLAVMKRLPHGHCVEETKVEHITKTEELKDIHRKSSIPAIY